MNGLIILRVIEGRNLASKDINGFSDPFVIIQASESGKVFFKDKTTVKKKTLNPHWDQKFEFSITPSFSQLNLIVYDKDFMRKEFMGELNFNPREVCSGVRIDDWFTLQKKKSSDKVSGEIHLIIQYLDAEYLETVNRILSGEISKDFRKPTKVVRTYLARGTDFHGEANHLYADAVVRFRTMCQQLSYELQIVDPLLSLDDIPYDEFDGLGFIEKEISICQGHSVGLHAVGLVGQKYGQPMLASFIPDQEYSKLKSNNSVRLDLLEKFYEKDLNPIQSGYRLRNINSQIYFKTQPPSYEQLQSRKQEYLQLSNSILRASESIFSSEEERQKYKSSFYSKSIEEGIIKETMTEKVLLLHRKLKNALPSNDSTFQDLQENVGSIDNILSSLNDKLVQKIPGTINKLEQTISLNKESNKLDSNNSETRNYLGKFINFIEDQLSSLLKKDLTLLEALPTDPVFEEALEHSIFWWEKMQGFVGQEKTLSLIDEYIRSSDEHPFCVVGPSGSGKTCTITVSAHKAQLDFVNDVVIMRFIGITPNSAEVSALLSSINQHICRMYGKDYLPQKSYQDVAADFREKISLGKPNKRLILFIDSLDQLSDDNRGRELEWLPIRLPPNCRLILSTLIDDIYRAYPSLKKVLPGEDSYAYLPPPTSEDSSKLLSKWLEDKGRKLTQTQHKVISSAFLRNPLPLYFKLAFDESCLWTSDTEVVDSSGNVRLPFDMRSLIDGMLFRAELKHTQELTSHTFGYITVAKHGLSSGELEDILSCDNVVLEAVFHDRIPDILRIPPLLWLRLRRDFQNYLVERTAQGANVFMWYHRQFWEAMEARYLKNKEFKKQLHRGIAEYFNETWIKGKEYKGIMKERYILPQPLHFSNFEYGSPLSPTSNSSNIFSSKPKFNLRKLTELPHHLCSAEMVEVEQVLTDLNFLYAKCASGLAFDLVREMVWGVKILGENPNLKLQHFLRFFRNQVHLLSIYPAITFQQAANFPESFQPTISSKKSLTITPQNWIEWVNKPNELDPCEVTFLCPSPVRCCDFSPSGTRMVSSSFDATLIHKSVKVWDTSTGAEMASLDGHQLGVNSCKFSKDDRFIATGSDDKLAKVWNAKTSLEVATFKSHEGAISDVVFSPDSNHLLTASTDTTIKLWKISNPSNPIRTFTGHTGQVSSVDFSPNGEQFCSVSEDKSVRVWSVSGNDCQVLKGHTEWIKSCAYSPNGRRIVSGGCDNTIIVWASQTSVLIRKLTGHDKWVTAVRYSSDGRYIASGSKDKTIRIWEDRTGNQLVVFSHSEWVRSLSFYNNQLLSSSMDRSVRLWNSSYEQGQKNVEMHSDEVTGIGVTLDLKYFVSISKDKSMKVWDYKNFKLVKDIANAHYDIISKIRFSSNKKDVATCSRDKTIKIWNSNTWELTSTLRGHSDWVRDIYFSQSGELLISCSYDGTLKIWDTSNWSLQFSKSYEVRLKHCLFVDKDKILVSIDDKIPIRFIEKVKNKWKDVHDKNQSTKFKYDPSNGIRTPEIEYIDCNSSSPSSSSSNDDQNSKMLVFGYSDGSTHLWDCENGEPLSNLPRQRFVIGHASFLKDGSILTLAGPQLRIFDPSKHHQSFFLPNKIPFTCAIQTEDSVLLVGNASGTIDKLQLHKKRNNNR